MSDERETPEGVNESGGGAGESHGDSHGGSHGTSDGGGYSGGGGHDGGGGLGKSSTGLDANVAALLACVLGFITGLVFIILEKDSRFVKFWAWQSFVASGSLAITSIVLSSFIPCIGALISMVLGLGGLVLWIVMMLKAYQGETWKVPIVGDFAEKQAGN